MKAGSMQLRQGDVLLVVDVQNDFLPGGALGVPGGDAIIPVLDGYGGKFDHCGLPVIASRDWHPPDHCSFRERGGPWPTHCVAGTHGAELAATLALPRHSEIVSKGTQREHEAYSAFQGTGLAERLRRQHCRRVFIGGLATDYCVRATALDALVAGFEVIVLEDAVRAVDVEPGDGARALGEMVAKGARLARLDEVDVG
ncbi:MAG: nicotinamidase [Steroidobacteraceae bacterium]